MWRIIIRDIEMRVIADEVEVTDMGVCIRHKGSTAYVAISEPFTIVEPAPAEYDALIPKE